jgi:hypothetical protein
VSRAEQARRAEEVAARRRQQKARQQERATRRQRQEQAAVAAIQAFWESLPAAERSRLETEALAGATPWQRALLAGGGRVATATRQAVLDACARAHLQQGAGVPATAPD